MNFSVTSFIHFPPFSQFALKFLKLFRLVPKFSSQAQLSISHQSNLPFFLSSLTYPEMRLSKDYFGNWVKEGSCVSNVVQQKRLNKELTLKILWIPYTAISISQFPILLFFHLLSGRPAVVAGKQWVAENCEGRKYLGEQTKIHYRDFPSESPVEKESFSFSLSSSSNAGVVL